MKSARVGPSSAGIWVRCVRGGLNCYGCWIFFMNGGRLPSFEEVVFVGVGWSYVVWVMYVTFPYDYRDMYMIWMNEF